MPIYVRCPFCKKFRPLSSKKCLTRNKDTQEFVDRCGIDFNVLKREKRARYYVMYRIPGSGKTHIKAAGTDLEKAKVKEAELIVHKDRGELSAMLPKKNPTFFELTKWYLEQEAIKDLAMFKKGVLQKHLEHFNNTFGDFKVNDLKVSMLKNFQTHQKKPNTVTMSIGKTKQRNGHSPSYIDQQVKAAQAMVNLAFEDDLISGDCLRPFKKTKGLLKRNANARDVVITKQQFDRLYDKCALHIKPIVATAFYTGMRKGEILNLTWDKVDLKSRHITLEAMDTKTDQPRRVPIFGPLYNILNALPRAIHTDRAFLNNGEPCKDINDGFKAACKRAGILYGRKVKGGITFHDLRHTFNTNARKAGIPEKLIMEITGHSTREMFDRYNSITDDESVAAEGQFMEFLESGNPKNDVSIGG